MKYLKMKLIARFISLQAFWQKLDFIFGGKILCKHYSKIKSTERQHLRMRIPYRNKDGRSKTIKSKSKQK